MPPPEPTEEAMKDKERKQYLPPIQFKDHQEAFQIKFQEVITSPKEMLPQKLQEEAIKDKRKETISSANTTSIHLRTASRQLD